MFVFLFLCFWSSLYVLDNYPSSDVSFTNIFPQSATSPFTQLTFSFTEKTFVILIKSSLSIIYVMVCFCGVVSKKSSSYPRSSKFFFVLSSRSFIVLHFAFKFAIHFELIFVKDVRSVSRFMFFVCGCLVVQAPFVEKTIFVSLNCLYSLSKINWICLCGSISGFPVLFHWFIFLFFHKCYSVSITVIYN